MFSIKERKTNAFLDYTWESRTCSPQHIIAKRLNTADSLSGLFYWCGSYTRRNKLKKTPNPPQNLPTKQKKKIVFCCLILCTSCLVCGFFWLCGWWFYHLLPILKSKLFKDAPCNVLNNIVSGRCLWVYLLTTGFTEKRLIAPFRPWNHIISAV